MLLRTLSLLLPVALTFADTLVGQSDIDALKDAFNSAAQTILEIRGACEEFANNVDIAHATVVTHALSILDSQLRNFTTLIPDHVMTDTDGKWACDAYAGDVTPATEFVEAINSRKDDFQAVHFLPMSAIVYRSSPPMASLSMRSSWPPFRQHTRRALNNIMMRLRRRRRSS
ncbi:hypothetical protein EV421DRAFT_280041 [Armillaria borealis]|uniref:Fungal N-terminal domain-containing protein n=1 Tax=Armillaria borealis TaxID=47425 RepID=A0AA39IU49_9AGAR|nr:hypothetical protein EV421DRAFT_280041 [Armillaria borealis]